MQLETQISKGKVRWMGIHWAGQKEIAMVANLATKSEQQKGQWMGRRWEVPSVNQKE